MHSQTSQPGQRRDNNKGHNKYQKKYVPKANDSASTTKLNEGKGEPNGSQNHDESRSGSLTSSLRQSSEKVNYRTGGQGGKIKQNDGSRRQVWRSGGSNEKSLPKKQGNYVKYLPQDDAVATGLGVEDGGIDVVETQGIADLLNQELRSLLRMKPREFWREDSSWKIGCEVLPKAAYRNLLMLSEPLDRAWNDAAAYSFSLFMGKATQFNNAATGTHCLFRKVNGAQTVIETKPQLIQPARNTSAWYTDPLAETRPRMVEEEYQQQARKFLTQVQNFLGKEDDVVDDISIETSHIGF
eukprot:Gb_29128 [translate_table: standard]